MGRIVAGMINIRKIVVNMTTRHLMHCRCVADVEVDDYSIYKTNVEEN